MGYKIKLEIYEGPMDLLLYLVKRDELDIQDIPIARIANEYLEYIKLMKLLDLEFAAEFVLMAATLMRIKVMSLLPAPVLEEGEEDPRFELQQRLFEYQKYKEAAVKLGQREEIARGYFPRSYTVEPVETGDIGVSLFDLLAAFKEILGRTGKIDVYEIEAPKQSVEERMEEILSTLAGKGGVEFTTLFAKDSTRLDIIVTFLAILELIRLQKIAVAQKKAFGEITIRLVADTAGSGQ
jgi:segregation and condensation protein A